MELKFIFNSNNHDFDISYTDNLYEKGTRFTIKGLSAVEIIEVLENSLDEFDISCIKQNLRFRKLFKLE